MRNLGPSLSFFFSVFVLYFGLPSVLAIAVPDAPKALIACYFDKGSELLLYRGCTAAARRLRGGGFEVTFLYRPTLKDLETQRASLPKGSQVFFKGHGNIIDLNNPNADDDVPFLTRNESELEEKQKKAKKMEEPKKAQLPLNPRHFIVKGHGSTATELQTTAMMNALDPGGGKLFFALDSCHGGQVCRDCEQDCKAGIVCTSSRADQLTYADAGYGYEDHFSVSVISLLVGAVDEFKKYSGGNCEMTGAQIRDFLKAKASFKSKTDVCEVQNFSNVIGKDGVPKAAMPNQHFYSDADCRYLANEAKDWAKEKRGRKSHERVEEKFLLTYKDGSGKEKFVMQVGNEARVEQATSAKELEHILKDDGWNWPKSCGEDDDGNLRENCAIYPRTLGKFYYISRDEPYEFEGQPSRGLFMYAKEESKDNPLMIQTPCVDRGRLRHPRCIDERTSAHRDRVPADETHQFRDPRRGDEETAL